MTTLDDVARAAGVSKSTVSRVLNGGTSRVPIGGDTRERIRAVAADLQYRPNVFARGLKSKRSRILGVAIRDFTNPFWGGLVHGISAQCTARGYHVILSNTASESEEEATAGALLGQIGVDGLLLIGDFPGDQEAVARILGRHEVVVAVCRSLDPNDAPVVRVDDRQGVQMMLSRMRDLGHGRIGYIGLAHPEGFAERHRAYEQFVRGHNLLDSSRVVELIDIDRRGFPSEDELVELGAAAARRVLQSGEPIDALFCACDPMAFGALRIARELGIDVPGHLSIVGFDDTPLARYCTPALTTIRQPVVEMGSFAADLLIDLVLGTRQRPADTVLFPPELVVRDSLGPRADR